MLSAERRGMMHVATVPARRQMVTPGSSSLWHRTTNRAREGLRKEYELSTNYEKKKKGRRKCDGCK